MDKQATEQTITATDHVEKASSYLRFKARDDIPPDEEECPEDIDLFELEDLFITFRDYNGCHRIDWILEACEAIESAPTLKQARQIYLRVSASSRRKSERTELAYDRIAGTWHMDEVVRLYFLCALQKATPDTGWPDMLFDVYRRGDENEKIVIIRALRWFSDDCDLLKIALDAGRSNSVDIFSSLALKNPYPAQSYPNDAFNRLILKALYLDLNIATVIELPQRCSPELSQLCIDLVKERLLANRPPPASIWMAMRFADLDEEGQNRWQEYLTQHTETDNFYACRGLLNHFPETLTPAQKTSLLQKVSQLISRMTARLNAAPESDLWEHRPLRDKITLLRQMLSAHMPEGSQKPLR